MNPEETLEKKVALLEKIVENLANIETRAGIKITDFVVKEIANNLVDSVYFAVRYFLVDPDLSRAFNMFDNSRRRVIDTALSQCSRDGIVAQTALMELLDVINVLLDVKPTVAELDEAKREKLVDLIMYQNLTQSVVEYFNADNR